MLSESIEGPRGRRVGPSRGAGLRRIVAIALLAGTALLYFHGLGSPRIYLSVEEVLQALQTHSIAATGRDLVGRWMPVYPSEPWYEAGRDPLWVYAGAGLLKIAPFSEALVRVPSAAAGVLSVALMFLVARRLFRHEGVALFAAAMLALTPAHFFQSRLATSQIGAVPFVLAWLLFLLKFLESGRRSSLFAATALLAAGTYSYLSAVFLMPLLLAATLLILAWNGRAHSWRPAVGGFLVVITPFVVWHIVHPERVSQLLGYYSANGYNADLVAPAPIVERLGTRLDVWWEALNPAPLFFSGDGNLRFSTGHSGHLLLPMFVFLIVGLAAAPTIGVAGVRRVLIAGLLLAPLPAILATSAEIKRWLAFLPFAILLAAAGVGWLWQRRVGRIVSVALLALSVLQFSSFLRDYWGDYRERSSFYYGGDMGTAVREILSRTDQPHCVMIDKRVPILDHWLLYTRIKGLGAEAQRPFAVDVNELPISIPPGCRRTGLLVHADVAAASGVDKTLLANGWRAAAIPEPGNKAFLMLFWYEVF